ncbi:MAG TPA: TIM-barrel domain-containing protein, partial [Solirubrobacteraceae bacterium]|nr:TIM-barrel domain-containing protein [Solirubrobacteraceae bacterium]
MPIDMSAVADALVLTRGELRATITRRPFAIDIRRGERRLIGGVGVWCADGEADDQFIQFTEGVIACEDLEIPERAASATLAEPLAAGADMTLRFAGGRAGRLRITLPLDDTVCVMLSVDGAPLRHAIGWDARAEEHFAGLGARHAVRVDHAGRRIQLGADRAYTGSDCPPDMIALGGVPQGDYAPAPWFQSSRGYAVHVDGHGNGMRFHFGADRTTVSARTGAGPLQLTLRTDRSPAARLRRQLRMTGLPPVLPEWGYGFWKSRDVYGHQTEGEDDFGGCRDHGIPLDALVLDSPWETQYNTWIPNPHQFPDFNGMVRRFRAAGV